MISIVLGLGFGDEGKGLATSFLCSLNPPDKSVVIRFNGGHQAGHTVVHDGHRHVFSSFGSGTLQDVPTYWSEYCTFYPVAFLNEYTALAKIKNNLPPFYVDPLCPVTTPWDLAANCSSSAMVKNGTCGVGFGTTLQRHENHYKLFVQDLFFKSVLKEKLKNIIKYYKWDSYLTPSPEEFLEVIEKIKDLICLRKLDEVVFFNHHHNDHLIFEGAQGILLDQDFGFFPNVTRSNTTSKNAFNLLSTYENLNLSRIYVTRTYQTRHGNGFMTNENLYFPLLKNAEKETNQNNQFQGQFRKSLLDLDLLKYSLRCDHVPRSQFVDRKCLIITCVDQTGEQIEVTENGTIKTIQVTDLMNMLDTNFYAVYLSYGDSFTTFEQIK